MIRLIIRMSRVAVALACCLAFRPVHLRAQSTILTHGFAVSAYGGSIYTAGETSHALAGQKNYGGPDAYVQAYDPNGNLLWTQQFGSTEEDRAAGIVADSTGVYTVGLTFGAMPGHAQNAGEDDSFIAKFNPSGHLAWLHQFGTSGADPATSVATDNAGSIYMAGVTGGNLAGTSAGGNDAYLRKYDSDGNVIWTAQFGTSGDDRAYGVRVDSGGIYVCGRTSGAFPGQTNFGGLDGFVTKFDTNGNQIWLTQFGSPDDDRGWDVTSDANEIYVTGRADGPLPNATFNGGFDAYVIEFDRNGNELWTNEFGTIYRDRSNAIVHANGQLYVAGPTTGAFPGYANQGGEDLMFSSLTTSGTLLWTVQLGTPGNDTGRGISSDSTGVYVAGEADGTLPGQTVASGGFLIKFDFSGNVLWIQEYSGNP